MIKGAKLYKNLKQKLSDRPVLHSSLHPENLRALDGFCFHRLHGKLLGLNFEKGETMELRGDTNLVTGSSKEELQMESLHSSNKSYQYCWQKRVWLGQATDEIWELFSSQQWSRSSSVRLRGIRTQLWNIFRKPGDAQIEATKLTDWSVEG